MGTVIIEQFNPKSGYWNKLYELNEADYDAEAPIPDKYGGPFRTRFVNCEVVEDISEEEIEEYAEDFVEDVREEPSYSWE